MTAVTAAVSAVDAAVASGAAVAAGSAVASGVDAVGPSVTSDPAAGAAPLHDLSELVVGDLVFQIAPPGDRKTIEIVVERDASLVLKAPRTVTVERAARFVAAKRRWVYRKLAEKDALTGPPVVKRFVEGEGFAYLGRSYRLTLETLDATSPTVRPDSSAVRPNTGLLAVRPDPLAVRPNADLSAGCSKAASLAVRLDRGRFRLRRSEADRGADAMRRWYTEVGGQWLRRRVRPWAARMGEESVAVEVRDLGYRWGSARPTDGPPRINVHWATLQLPPSLIDYILVHELAHLREANHTPEFWSIVDRLMPGYETQKTTLAAIGKTIWLGSVFQ